jgi:hypothetical protein
MCICQPALCVLSAVWVSQITHIPVDLTWKILHSLLHAISCLTFILLMWRIGRAPNSIPVYSYIQQDAMLHSLFISGNCSTCFGWYFHPSSGAHTIVSTASDIVTAICHYRARVGTGLSVLRVAYATHSTTLAKYWHPATSRRNIWITLRTVHYRQQWRNWIQDIRWKSRAEAEPIKRRLSWNTGYYLSSSHPP